MMLYTYKFYLYTIPIDGREEALMVRFGERLKAARNAKRLSQQALADIIGKSLNTIGLYERGLRQPSLETLCLLADTLDVSVDYLLARTEVRKYDLAALESEAPVLSTMNVPREWEERLRRVEVQLGLI